MEALDAFIDLDEEQNKDVSIAFDFYLFFCQTLSSTDMVERWMACILAAMDNLQYKDEVHLARLQLEEKLLIQHFKEENRPQKCREETVKMNWSSNESFVASVKKV